jgi:hypothetical protein
MDGPVTYDKYTYLIIDSQGIAYYVDKRQFEEIDNEVGFVRRKISADGHHIIGYIRQLNTSNMEH